MINKTPLYLLLTMALLLSSLTSLTSCNKDKDDDDIYSYSTSTQTTLVTGFSLQADADVLTSLDSVHFTVDYDNGLIYNADSLPVGTDITALKVTVNFLNTVQSAVFTITGATNQADTTISYTSSMTKSLDFTGKTTLTVTSYDETQVKNYDVKVLVHKVNPDSLVWPMSWRRDLPGYQSGVTGYKAVQQGNLYRVMTQSATECCLWTATAPNQGTWSKMVLNLDFTPVVSSLVATGEALYVLANDGLLYTSLDGTQWTSCGVMWYSILGAYDNRVLGVVRGDDAYYHDEYPHTEGFVSTAVEDGFPVSRSSNLVQAANTWAVDHQAILVGGVDSQGNVISDTWGYDGTTWGKINNIHSTLPALTEATLFCYYTYKSLPGVRRYGRQVTWYVMGGKKADGKLNKTIYLSNAQGVIWTEGDSTIAQPGYMPPFYGAQAFVSHETLTTDATSYVPRRVKSMDSTWDCPFIYLFGGLNEQGTLLPYVWRGVYNRLTNYPVY